MPRATCKVFFRSEPHVKNGESIILYAEHAWFSSKIYLAKMRASQNIGMPIGLLASAKSIGCSHSCTTQLLGCRAKQQVDAIFSGCMTAASSWWCGCCSCNHSNLYQTLLNFLSKFGQEFLNNTWFGAKMC